MQAGHLHDLNPDAAGIIYEVHVYSLEAASLGQVLHAKQIRAAHCLTSVQFSPTSEHLLLAYGRSAFTFSMHVYSHSLLVHSLFHACACMHAVIHWSVHSFTLACMCMHAFRLSLTQHFQPFNHSCFVLHMLRLACYNQHAEISVSAALVSTMR